MHAPKKSDRSVAGSSGGGFPEPDLETSRGEDPDREEDAVVRDAQPDEDVGDDAGHGGAADVVVLPVPVPPHLGPLARPHQERQHLEVAEGEDGDAERLVAVAAVQLELGDDPAVPSTNPTPCTEACA